MRKTGRTSCALFALLTLAACDGNGPSSPDADGPAPRTYRMGFGPTPPRASLESLIETIEEIADVSEIALIQQPVQWAALLDSTQTMEEALADVHKQQFEDLLVVSPDVGGVVRARALAKRLDSDLAIIDKRRPKANVAEVMNIIGDVEGRTCVIMDDIVDTANTLCKAATALKEHGATKVVAYCTHPVLSGGAVSRIATSDIDELVVTDTIPLTEEAQACPQIRQLSCAQLLAETMTRISNEESVSSLFTE